MFSRCNYKRKREFIILWFVFFTFLKAAQAHSPHDVIDALAVSPNFDQDQTVFIAISSSLRKSTDGGYSWSGVVNGLDNKSLITDIVISPAYNIDKTVFVATSGDGVYKSENGGKSWNKTNDGLGLLDIDTLAISPHYEKDKIIIGLNSVGKLYRSENGGELWTEIWTGDAKITTLAFLSHLMEERVIAGDEQGHLHISSNQGRHWQTVVGEGLGSAVTTITASSPNIAEAEIFVGTKQPSLYKSVDGGKTFEKISDTLNANSAIISIGVSPDYSLDNRVIVSTWYDAVFISEDKGKHWRKHDSGITKDSQADKKKYFSPHFRDIQFSNNFNKEGIIFLGGFDGLFKSYDKGASWQQLETLPLRIVKGMDVGKAENNARALAVGTYGGGGYITEDDGVTWTISNVGLKKTRLSGIVFSPNYVSDHTIFAGASGVLLKSEDSGKRWKRNDIELTGWRHLTSSGFIKLGLDSLADLVLPRASNREPYPIAVVISPNYVNDKRVYFSTREHGVFMFDDGEHDSTQMWDTKNKVVAELIISPDFGLDKTLFASVRGKGIYKSKDGGENWVAVNNGLEVVGEWKGKVHHGVKINDIFLAISESYAEDQTLFAATSNGLYRTIDGGKQWSKIISTAYEADSYINAVALSPDYSKDGSVLISIKGKGLYKGENKGDSFNRWSSALIDENHDVTQLIFSPTYAKDKTVYASSYEEVFISKDKGLSWEMIKRPVRYENHREVVHYSAGWSTKKGKEYSANMISVSEAPGSTLSLDFVGQSITWIGTRSDEQGKAKVYIDNQLKAEVDQFASKKEMLVKTFEVNNLSQGSHNIRVEVLEESNPDSRGHRIEVDAFDVMP